MYWKGQQSYPDACQLAVPDCISDLRPRRVFKPSKAQQGQVLLYADVVGWLYKLLMRWVVCTIIVCKISCRAGLVFASLAVTAGSTNMQFDRVWQQHATIYSSKENVLYKH